MAYYNGKKMIGFSFANATDLLKVLNEIIPEIEGQIESLNEGKVDKVEGERLIPEEDLLKLNELPTREHLEEMLAFWAEVLLDRISEKQNISNELTEIKAPDGYANSYTLHLDGKTQHYLINYAGEENDIYFEIVLDNILNKADEHTFYVYLKIASENIPSLIITTIDTSTGAGKPIKWLDTPTIEYPHTEMLLAFQTTDRGHSWIANQCYSLEVTE